jgi:hypothetical protein
MIRPTIEVTDLLKEKKLLCTLGHTPKTGI